MAGYDERLGGGYAAQRRPDPRLAAQIRTALGDVRRVINVGAGAGSYEPDDLEVVAVEPSVVMRAQRRPGAAPCVAAQAEDLPFADGEFDAAMAVLTVHHWGDWRAGCAELRRVAGRCVALTWDPAVAATFWLVDEYVPRLLDTDRRRFPATLADQAQALGATRVETVLDPPRLQRRLPRRALACARAIPGPGGAPRHERLRQDVGRSRRRRPGAPR